MIDDNRIHVASLLDVGGMKLAVIQKRAEAKDYLDIEALLDAGQTLDRLLSAGLTIHGKQFNPAVASVRLDRSPALSSRGTIGEEGLLR